MALTFATEIALESSTFPFLGHEPNNNFYNYYINNKHRASDKVSVPSLGTYGALTWGTELHHMTNRVVSRIGVKSFPHIGAMGFYKDRYTGIAWILIPIHVEQTKYTAPTLALTVGTSSIAVTVTPPNDITYTCYKIIQRCEYFANEYVVYETSTEIPLPDVIGDYDVWAIGYNETTGICSLDSNIIEVSITSGKSNWSPAPISIPMSLADLTDVNLVDLLNAQLLRYNSTSGKWENADMGDVLTITLLVANWTGAAVPYTQTISLAGIIATGYSYVVTPDDDSWYTYGACGIYMEDPTTDGSITFNATSAMPAVALTVNILKVRAS
jgi:hypothetical protein